MSTSIEIRHDSAEIGSSGHEHRVAGSAILFESGRVGGSYTSGLGRVTGRNVWPDTTWTQLREMPGASAWTIIIRQSRYAAASRRRKSSNLRRPDLAGQSCCSHAAALCIYTAILSRSPSGLCSSPES